MFQLTHPDIYNIPSFSFQHPDGYQLQVLPSEGAVIMDLTIKGKSILAAYQSKQEINDMLFYKNEILTPFPNRIQNGTYLFEHKIYQFPINNPEFQAALHGFVYNKSFEVMNTECRKNSCSITLSYTYSGDQMAFPFPFNLELKYSLHVETGFQLDYHIQNTGKTKMPVGFGWHPYFTFGKKINEATLRLPKVEKIEVNKNMIPTGKKYIFNNFDTSKKIGDYQLDTCFRVVENSEIERIEVSLECENHQISYWQKTGQRQFNYIQLYIPPDRLSIAIEPMTCNIDAFNNKEGLVVLAPDEVTGSSCGVDYF